MSNYPRADPAIRETADTCNPPKETLLVVAVPGADVAFMFRGADVGTGAVSTGWLAKENGVSAQKILCRTLDEGVTAGETKSRAENQLCAANRRRFRKRFEMHLNPEADLPTASNG